MKKLLPLAIILAAPLLSQAQVSTAPAAENKSSETAMIDTLEATPVADINWSAFVNRDFVAIGEQLYDVLSLDPGMIIQVRFYGRGMSPLINSQRDGGKPLAFLKPVDSRIIAVEGTTDGGIKVILATADRIGPFMESFSLKSPFYSYTATIKGLVQDPADKDKKKQKDD